MARTTTLPQPVVERMASNVLFNDTLNTFYLRLYGVRHMVKEYSDSERANPLPPLFLLLFLISSSGSSTFSSLVDLSPVLLITSSAPLSWLTHVSDELQISPESHATLLATALIITQAGYLVSSSTYSSIGKDLSSLSVDHLSAGNTD